MRNSEIAAKIEELIPKFENGKERFNTSIQVNRCIQALARGADPISIIDQLIQSQERLQKDYEDYVINDRRPILIPKQDI